MTRLALVVDLARCVGCYGCQIACRVEHATPPGVTWTRVVKIETGEFPRVRLLSVPLQCMHCGEAPCVAVCPTGASHRREDGTVAVDASRCLGCRYCELACPYGARYFVAAANGHLDAEAAQGETTARPELVGTVTKCDLCAERRSEGLLPACVERCTPRARIFGDLDDPESEASRLVRTRGGFTLSPELGTRPSVHYLPP